MEHNQTSPLWSFGNSTISVHSVSFQAQLDILYAADVQTENSFGTKY